MAVVHEWRWAINTTNRLPATAKFVALSLSLSMTANGYCDKVSGDTLKARTGLARSTVMDAIRVLDERGWLRRGKRRLRRGAGGWINTYEVTFPEWHQAARRTERYDDPAF